MSTHALDVLYTAERDVTAWEQRHGRGEVPGRWPYGLHELAGGDVAVRAVGLPEPGRLRGAAARLAAPALAALQRSAGTGVGSGARRTALAWDENLAHRASVLAPRTPLHAGAIWITDALARGRDDDATRARVRALRRAEGVWCLSSAQVEPLERLLPGVPVSMLRFGVDADFFRPQPYPDRPLVVSAGRDRDRDAETLFAALAEVLRAHPDAEAVVQTRSSATPPPGVRVVEHMPHTELRALYARASAVVVATSPNLHVSGMTVALEAMACARPAVLTATAGAADYVRHGETGLLAAPGDAAGLANALVSLLDDPAAAAAMGERGRLAVESDFNTSRMVRDLRELVGLPAIPSVAAVPVAPPAAARVGERTPSSV
ncbi:Glycosyl transferases group 1 [Quadrisphaera granulorum]|uniref:Glycosyl transferase family 1 n=1 Tax=Quadrisphaera granulorum TaxID=317664 RepID=A0A316B0L9_9ACTN|nr:glycosyltransferase [Quadrisphaera granulorum]PWJ56047.1 glycosyl transferase family 1 [Quadrisphaera granulorum]SZE94681.1 Glycosyl transferases group 1 [Quadrisphaera granulorum]